VDYYNSSNIQVGDIVIIDDSNPQSCEGGRIAEPYTRLRVRALEVDPYSNRGEVRARLETERESVPLERASSLLNMQGQPMLQKADGWLEATKAAYNLAKKKSTVFGKLNSKQLLKIIMLLCVIFLIAVIFWVMRMHSTSAPATSEVVLRIVLGSAIGVVAGAVIAHVLIPKINAMDDARKRAADLEERLRLYRQANPDCTNPSVVSDDN
jgi:hypothetical protein